MAPGRYFFSCSCCSCCCHLDSARIDRGITSRLVARLKRRLDADRNRSRAPMELHYGFVTKHRWEVDRERFHLCRLRRRHIHAKYLEARARIWLMKHERSSAENDS